MDANNDPAYIAAVANITFPFFLTAPSEEAIARLVRSLQDLAHSDEGRTLAWQDADRGVAAIETLVADYLNRGPDLAELDAEYNTLFIGPNKMDAPPWGSVYMDSDRVLYGNTWVKLKTWMRRNGIEFSCKEYKDPEDHMGILLAMLAFIAQRGDDELALDLIGNHILTWSHHYLNALEHAATSSFYKGVASFADNLLEGLAEHYGVTVAKPRYYR